MTSEGISSGFVNSCSCIYLDKIADDLQNAAVTLLAEIPDRVPQTDDSTAQFINRFLAGSIESIVITVNVTV